MGSALVLFETASLKDLAYPYTSSDGKPLGNTERSMRNLLPYDKNTWTLEQNVDYLESGVWLGLESVAREPERWALDELYRVPRNAIESTNGPWAFVLPAGQRDMYAVYDQLKVLQDGKAEIERATAPFTAGGKNYPAGSYVIKTRQPMGAWVNQVLGNRPYPNARNCPSCPLLMPYSEATDSEPTMLGITADPVAASFSARPSRVADVAPQTVLMPQPPAAAGAYLVEPSSEGVSYFLTNLQEQSVPTFRAAETFSAGGRGLRARHAGGPAVGDRAGGARGHLEDDRPAGLRDRRLAEGRRLRAQARHPRRPDPRHQQPGRRLADVAARPASRQLQGRQRGRLPAPERALRHDPDAGRHLAGADRQRDRSRTRCRSASAGRAASARRAGTSSSSSCSTAARWSRSAARATPPRRCSTFRPSTCCRRRCGSPARSCASARSAGVPELWGMPAQWATWSENDTGWRVTDYAKAKVGSSYPNDAQPLLASGYAEGDAGLRGLADIVTFDVGKGHVMISATDLNFRTWPRAAWTVIANAIYQGPSTPVAAAEAGRS